jgi:nicotinamidase-related amidase
MKSALLIIDVQNVLCVGKWACFDIDAVVDRINAIAAAVRASGNIVVFVQHEEDSGLLQFDSDGWQLYARLDVRSEDVRVRKTACDSFHRTDLHARLQSLAVRELLICGLQSEFCVDSTVRGALAHGYPVTLIADAHSTIDNGVLSAAQISAHHNATLANVTSFGPPVKVTLAANLRM